MRFDFGRHTNQLISGQLEHLRQYRFPADVTALPISRMGCLGKQNHEPITFREASYLLFNQSSEEHVFIVQQGGQLYCVPLLLLSPDQFPEPVTNGSPVE